jgi:SOS-response transcriptional repressor LexA
MTSKFPDQAKEIGETMASLGVSSEELATKLIVKPDTMRKYARGYQKASPRLMQQMRELLSNAASKSGQTLKPSQHVKRDGGSGHDAVTFYQNDSGLSPREALRAAVAKRGWSMAQLAKVTRYPAGILDGVVNGMGRISEDMAKAIHREMPEISVEEMLEGSETPRVMDRGGLTGTHGATPDVKLAGKTKSRNVPVISWAAAGSLATIDALDEGYAHDGITSNVPGRAFAVEVRGDSMLPTIQEGDQIVVRADIEPRPGQIVLVRTIHGDVLCKRFQTRDGGKLVVLSSVNQSYLPYEIPASDIAWIYPVKQIVRNL